MRTLAIAFLGFLLLASGISSAATLRVPSQFATIQAAADFCANGDTILVAPGVYAGDRAVLVNKASITIIGESGRDYTFVPDGIFALYPTCSGCTIKGFTVPVLIFFGSSDCSVSECDLGYVGVNTDISECYNISIIGNRIHEYPPKNYGIEIRGHSIIIEANDIRNCTGGGISLTGLGPETSRIQNNTIVSNNGEGILVSGVAIVEGNVIEKNTSAGVRISWVSGGTTIIKENIIVENVGDGILFASFTEIAHNTIARNGSCGMRTQGGSTGDIHHNLIALNGYAGVLAYEGFNATIRCNDVWKNSNLPNGNYIGFVPDQTGFNGNISTDPFFCNASGGVYSLAANSPALHASCGIMGAIATPGCSNQTAVQQIAWEAVKELFK